MGNQRVQTSLTGLGSKVDFSTSKVFVGLELGRSCCWVTYKASCTVQSGRLVVGSGSSRRLSWSPTKVRRLCGRSSGEGREKRERAGCCGREWRNHNLGLGTDLRLVYHLEAHSLLSLVIHSSCYYRELLVFQAERRSNRSIGRNGSPRGRVFILLLQPLSPPPDLVLTSLFGSSFPPGSRS
jgi:hypothetical protein